MLSPDQFSAVASAWVGSAVVVIGAITAGLLLIVPKLASIREQLTTLFKAKEHAEIARANLQTQITQVALATPAIVTPNGQT